jgi:mRNA-degrading endonuclease RelE of RelBE toxin-antitoxin system
LPAAMGKKTKASKANAEPAAVAPPPDAEMIPISSAPLPLKQLDARALGEFLELCFGDRRLLELCGELRLYSPGYRLEAMPPNQVARMLADEARAAEDAANLLDKAIRDTLRNPVLESKPLSDEHYRDLLEMFTGDPLQHLARVAWRALIEEDEKLRAYALSAIDLGVEALDAPAKAAAPQRKPQLPADVQELRKQLEEARKTADRAGKERDSMREQLASARTDIVTREKTVADVREELSQARTELTRASADVARLTAAGDGRALSEARRLADESRSLSERLRIAVEERDALRAQLAQAQRATAAPAAVNLAPAAEEEALPSAEEASTFLIPIFTREFYDSIQRWDRRMQRAAFDKVSLLARDWRHGSLRAIALEGLPGYYRIRIATDVRLIYRRGEGNTVEILSLIDREDLDRYIRQARTR